MPNRRNFILNLLRHDDAYMRRWTVITGSGNGLPLVRRQSIAPTSAEVQSILTRWTNFDEIKIKKRLFSVKQM